jgi:hypothetical protein
MKMKDNEKDIVEINSEIYQFMSLWAMRVGRDNVTDFINDILKFELEFELERIQKQGKGDTVGRGTPIPILLQEFGRSSESTTEAERPPEDIRRELEQD